MDQYIWCKLMELIDRYSLGSHRSSIHSKQYNGYHFCKTSSYSSLDHHKSSICYRNLSYQLSHYTFAFPIGVIFVLPCWAGVEALSGGWEQIGTRRTRPTIIISKCCTGRTLRRTIFVRRNGLPLQVKPVAY